MRVRFAAPWSAEAIESRRVRHTTGLVPVLAAGILSCMCTGPALCEGGARERPITVVAAPSARQRATWREDVTADIQAVSAVLSQAAGIAFGPVDLKEWDPAEGANKALPVLWEHMAMAYPECKGQPILVLTERPPAWRFAASRGRVALAAPVEGAGVWPYLPVAALYDYWDADTPDRQRVLCRTLVAMFGGFRDAEPGCAMNGDVPADAPLALCPVTAQVVGQARDIAWDRWIGGLGPQSLAAVQLLFRAHGLPGDASPVVAGWYDMALATGQWAVLERALLTDPVHPHPLVLASLAVHGCSCPDEGYLWACLAEESYQGPDPVVRSVLMAARGDAAAASARLDEALSSWERAAETDPLTYFVAFHTQDKFLLAGSHDDLRRIVNRAVQVVGASEPTIALAYANSLALDGETEQAAAVVDAAQKEAPTDVRLVLLTAKIQVSAGRPDLASAALRQAEQLDPDFGDTQAAWVDNADALGLSTAERLLHAAQYLRVASVGPRADSMRALIGRLAAPAGGK